MASNAEWSTGYARQADADFQMYQRLEASAVAEPCHRLLFLQMACEKLVKAHSCGEGVDAAALQRHAVIAGRLPVILRQRAIAVNLPNRNWVLQHAKHLSQEIELLAPAVRRAGHRPDNCEYPWEDDMEGLHVPLDWSFLPARLVAIPAGVTFLKLVRGAIDELLPAES